MARDVFIFVNGILSSPGDAFAWTDRAASIVTLSVAEQASRYASGLL